MTIRVYVCFWGESGYDPHRFAIIHHTHRHDVPLIEIKQPLYRSAYSFSGYKGGKDSMQKDFVAMSQSVEAGAKSLGGHAPELMKTFHQLTSTASANGVLDTKTKELMAVAISIITHCDGCIAYHTKASLKAGATREEVVETIGVAIEMGGGPAMVYGASALEAYEQFMQVEFSSEKVG